MKKITRKLASHNPATMCCKTGFLRTSIIGLGRSTVSSRMRLPRPAARTTAFSIFMDQFYSAQFGTAAIFFTSGCRALKDVDIVFEFTLRRAGEVQHGQR